MLLKQMVTYSQVVKRSAALTMDAWDLTKEPKALMCHAAAMAACAKPFGIFVYFDVQIFANGQSYA